MASQILQKFSQILLDTASLIFQWGRTSPEEKTSQVKPATPIEAPSRLFPFRVIDTHSLEFTENLNDYGRKGGYAILSHTWTPAAKGGEVLYAKARLELFKNKKTQEMVEALGMGKKLPPSVDPGTAKLLNAIHAAKNMGHRFIWVDSCCFNQSDKTEEAIAIPSMGDWYMNADICLVFLDGLALCKQDVSKLHMPTEDWARAMPPPSWATRGWTLQEIVLSQRAVFFNENWEQVFEFDRKKPPSLELLETARVLYKLCRIPELLICNGAKPDVSPGMILNLAATRNTSVPADRVYSLMGLFNVKMRPVSGEGFEEAFDRLSQHLFTKTGDRAILESRRQFLERFYLEKIYREKIYLKNPPLEGNSLPYASRILKSSSTLGVFNVYPIDRLTFPQPASDIYAVIKAIFSADSGKFKLDSSRVLRTNCQLVWGHGKVIQVDITCRMESLLLLFGGKTEWVLLRSKENIAFNRWYLAEITQEKRIGFEDDIHEIFARKIFSFQTDPFLDPELSHSRMRDLELYVDDIDPAKSETIMSWEELEMHVKNSRECV